MEIKQIALTFDDGPSSHVTPRILDILKKYNAKATFFVIGTQASENRDLIQRIHAEGHQIGNHSWNHESAQKITSEELRESLLRTSAVITESSGVAPLIHRPPYGDMNEESVKTVGRSGMATIVWSVDPKDWKLRGADVTVRLVLDNSEDGDIVLLHDIHEQTADALEIIVPEMVRRGFSLVTVAELSAAKHTPLIPGQFYLNFHVVKGEKPF